MRLSRGVCSLMRTGPVSVPRCCTRSRSLLSRLQRVHHSCLHCAINKRASPVINVRTGFFVEIHSHSGRERERQRERGRPPRIDRLALAQRFPNSFDRGAYLFLARHNEIRLILFSLSTSPSSAARAPPTFLQGHPTSARISTFGPSNREIPVPGVSESRLGFSRKACGVRLYAVNFLVAHIARAVWRRETTLCPCKTPLKCNRRFVDSRRAKGFSRKGSFQCAALYSENTSRRGNATRANERSGVVYRCR